MTIQKRVLAGVLALAMALSLAACGSSSGSSSSAGSASSSSQSTAAQKAEGLVTAVEETSFTILTQDEEELTFSADEDLIGQLSQGSWAQVEYSGEGTAMTAQGVKDVSSITYEGVVKDAAMNTLVLETETGDELNFTTTIAQKDLADGLTLGMNVAVTCPFGYEPDGDQAGLAIQISQLESSAASQAGSAADDQTAASAAGGTGEAAPESQASQPAGDEAAQSSSGESAAA